MEKFPEVIKLTSQQGILHFNGKSLEFAQRLHRRCFSLLIAINLILDDVSRQAHRSGITEKEIVLYLVKRIGTDLEWINDDVVRQKFDVVEATKGSSILGLEAPLKTKPFTLN